MLIKIEASFDQRHMTQTVTHPSCCCIVVQCEGDRFLHTLHVNSNWTHKLEQYLPLQYLISQTVEPINMSSLCLVQWLGSSQYAGWPP